MEDVSVMLIGMTFEFLFAYFVFKLIEWVLRHNLFNHTNLLKHLSYLSKATIDGSIMNAIIAMAYDYGWEIDEKEIDKEGEHGYVVLVSDDCGELRFSTEMDNLIMEGYVTSSRRIISPNFIYIMQDLLSHKYKFFEFQDIESDSENKLTMTYRCLIRLTRKNRTDMDNVMDRISYTIPIRKDIIRILNYNMAALGDGFTDADERRLIGNLLS